MQKTIVLIEDQSMFSKIIKQSIENQTNYRVLHLNDGSTILDMLNTYQPHLLVLDYELPGKNGIELYDLIHSTSGWEHLPMIMLSADLPQQALASRGIMGLTKPCQISELIQTINTLLT